MAARIVHYEIMGPDGAALHEFYHQLLGWKGEAVPGFGDYYMIDADQTGVGGAVGQGSEEMPSYMTMYAEVDAIDPVLAKAQELGGSVVVPRTVIPGTVTFALFTDPAGNMMGIVEPDTPES